MGNPEMVAAGRWTVTFTVNVALAFQQGAACGILGPAASMPRICAGHTLHAKREMIGRAR